MGGFGFGLAVGGDGVEFHELLCAVDPDTDLWSPDRAQSLDAATELWKWLSHYHDVGPVIAGKLMARKRPRLVPIVDKVVTDTLQAPRGTYWDTIAEVLCDKGRRDQVDALRPDGLTDAVTTLRLFDVAIWMLGSLSKPAERVRNDYHVAEPIYRSRRRT